MIATALSCNPHVPIADEPTTALDVTTQAQILGLMRELQNDFDTAILFITHDLGVVAEIADDVAVTYLGNVVGFGDVDTIFNDPKHPYTHALLGSIPKAVWRKATAVCAETSSRATTVQVSARRSSGQPQTRGPRAWLRIASGPSPVTL